MDAKEEIIRDMSRRLYRLLNKHARLESLPATLSDGLEVTHRELHFVEAIGDRNPINITELAKHFGVTKSAASQMVTKLVRMDLVKKQVAGNSNREYELRLTKNGEEAYSLHEKSHQEGMKEILSRLGALTVSQIATTTVVLEIMEGVLDERME